MKQKSAQILKSLQHNSGLFSASNKQVTTGYNRAWLRDCVYEAIGLEYVDMVSVIRTYQGLLDVMLKHEGKIDWAIMEKPIYRYQYIHARYDPSSLDEIWEEWGNKQNDAVGAFLFKVADLTRRGHQIIRNRHDFRIIQKLVFYLESIEFWHDRDNGIWEEDEEVHASSIGACLAALQLLKRTEFRLPLIPNDFYNDFVPKDSSIITRRLYIPETVIKNARKVLDSLLPRESATKDVDLALLSLIYPYNIVSKNQRREILRNVESKLVRYKGVVRYIGDRYYRNSYGEACWTMGFPWLAIIYKRLHDKGKFHFYMYKTHSAMNDRGELPELYYSNTDEHNENSPLGWSQALYIVACSI